MVCRFAYRLGMARWLRFSVVVSVGMEFSPVASLPVPVGMEPSSVGWEPVTVGMVS